MGICFHMFFLDVVPLKKHVNKSEMQLAPDASGSGVGIALWYNVVSAVTSATDPGAW